MKLILNFNNTFADNIVLITKALIDCDNPTIENRIEQDSIFMASTGNALSDNHLAILRATDYGLISEKENAKLWELFAQESRQKYNETA